MSDSDILTAEWAADSAMRTVPVPVGTFRGVCGRCRYCGQTARMTARGVETMRAGRWVDRCPARTFRRGHALR